MAFPADGQSPTSPHPPPFPFLHDEGLFFCFLLCNTTNSVEQHKADGRCSHVGAETDSLSVRRKGGAPFTSERQKASTLPLMSRGGCRPFISKRDRRLARCSRAALH